MSAAYFGLMPQVIVGIWIMVLLLADSFIPEDGKRSIAALASVGVIGALVVAVLALPNPPPPESQLLFNGTVAVDAFSLFFEAIFLALTALVLMIAPAYLDRRGIQKGEFYILLLAALEGMMVLVSATSLMTIFIGVELLSIALYVLSAFLRRQQTSQEAGLKYLLMGGFASGFLLYGMALLYGGTGTTSVALIATRLSRLSGDSLLFSLVGIGLVFVGMAFKASAAPFHAWTPDVYEGAPTPVVAFMAVGTKVAAIAVFLRIFVVGFGSSVAAGRWTLLVGAVAAVSMLVGAVGALRQQNLKRLLAYSSIAHAGYLMLAVVSGSQQGMVSGLYYLGAYSVMTFGAFAVVSILTPEASDVVRVSDLRGLGYRQPLLGGAMALFMLSLGGFPPTVGFFGKLFVFQAAIKAGYGPLTVVAIVASAISIYYYLRVVAVIYAPAPVPAEESARPDVMGSVAVAIAGLLTLGLGLLPGLLYNIAQRSSLL
ncbi:MAG: NADH-quinone oxidoreductase subunit N [Candidatus Dormibacteria bacterium]